MKILSLGQSFFELIHWAQECKQEVHFAGVIIQQRCGLTKITRSPKFPNHETLGAQQLSLYEESIFF